MANAKDHAAVTAISMGLSLLTRASESTQTTANHFIRARDVTFHMRGAISGVEFDIKASEAHLHEQNELLGVTTYFRSMKNDQLGRGGISTFPVTVIGADAAYCVASDMFSWAIRGRPLADDPFLSHSGSVFSKPWALTRSYFNKLIKLSAKTCGFDPARFTTHSCRIGGATLLAAAGHPNHYIQHAGRWRSTAFLDYISWAVKSMEKAISSLVNPTLFTNANMLRLHPYAAPGA